MATRARIRKPLALIGAALASIGLALALTGCEATDVDVYIPTSETVRYADGRPDLVKTYTLDEHGNAVTVAERQGEAGSTVEYTYDPYGVANGCPTLDDASIDTAVELDDRGQPTSISITTDLDGGQITYTYYDVRGRIETVEVTRADGRSQTKRYDRDGWPLEETVTDSDGTVHEVSYVYEINENGAVTKMYVSTDGDEPQAFTFTYDENGCIATVTAPDGTVTSYTYELVKDPSPYAMAQALLRMPV